MNSRIFGLIILTLISCGNLFAQDVEEEEPGLFELVTGFNDESFFYPPFEIIVQSFSEELKNAGFSSPSEMSSRETAVVVPLWFQVIDSTRTEVKNAILEEISEEELKDIQQRCLLFNFYSDWNPRIVEDDPEEGGRIYLVSEVLFNPCEILDFSPEQEQLYREIRNNTAQAMLKLSAENELFDQEIAVLYVEIEENGIKKINKNFRTQFESILTDKQKSKLQKMKNEMPESLWKIMPGNDGPGNDGKERPWRPGNDSWKPGMGVPKDLENHPGEQKRSNNGKPFPNQE